MLSTNLLLGFFPAILRAAANRGKYHSKAKEEIAGSNISE
jgi:hypothetical protein